MVKWVNQTEPTPESGGASSPAPLEAAAADQLALLWNYSKDIVTVLDVDGTWRWSSPAGTRLLGYPPGYDPEGGLFSLVHPDDLGIMVDAFAGLLDGSRPGSNAIECRVGTASGEWRWYETVGEVMLDDPLVRGILLWSHDVTDRREAERARTAASARFETVFHDSPAGVVIADNLGSVLRANPAVERMLQLGPREAEGRPLTDWLDSSDMGSAQARRDALVAGQPIEPVQRRLRRQDGSWLDCQIDIARLTGSEPAAVVLHVTDLTEVVAAQRRTAEAEERFSKVFAVAPVGMVVCGPDGRIIEANDMIANILGWSKEELVGLDPRVALVSEEDATSATSRIMAAAAGKEDHASVLRQLKRRGGETRWCRTSVGTLADNDSSNVVVYVEDVHEQVLASQQLSKSESRYRLLTESASDVIALTGPDGICRYVSPSVEAVLGYRPDELVGNSGLYPIEVGEHQRVVDAYERAVVNERDEFQVEVRARHKGGHELWLQLTSRLVRDDYGEALELRTSVHDITELHRAHQALESSERRFRSLVQQSFEYTMVWRADGILTFVSPNAERDSGGLTRTGGQVASLELLHPDDVARVVACATEVAESAQGTSLELRYRTRFGPDREDYRWLEGVMTNLLDDPDVGGVVMNARDVTDKVAVENNLAHQAVHDELTGLLNRAALLDELGQLGGHSPVAVLFCDLDNFKTVNDTLGHDTGDRLLREVADRLSGAVRQGDLVARFGGDEFVVICPGTDRQAALAAAERICGTLSEPVVLHEGTFPVMASIGVAVRGAGEPTGDLLRDADTAMYAAKAHGRNRAVVFDPAMRDAALARAAAEAQLRDALGQNDVVAWFQPLVELGTERVVGFETLARWEDPVRGLVLPVGFLEVAEESGLIVDLDLAMLRQALEALGTWRASGHDDVRVSVNCSPATLRLAGFDTIVAEELSSRGLEPAALCLEVTEGTLVGDDEATTDTLAALHELGVSLAVDDFGTGYSGLAQLKSFPASMVKIDKAFVAGLGADMHDEAIVTAVLAMADALGLEACAEGIENVEQADLLAARGCRTGQGHLFSPAVPGEQAAEMLRAGLPTPKG
jgi:diguanylate cyclase (GGDEF)-like protein/PAS domain S-box-containing protein